MDIETTIVFKNLPRSYREEYGIKDIKELNYHCFVFELVKYKNSYVWEYDFGKQHGRNKFTYNVKSFEKRKRAAKTLKRKILYVDIRKRIIKYHPFWFIRIEFKEGDI